MVWEACFFVFNQSPSEPSNLTTTAPLQVAANNSETTSEVSNADSESETSPSPENSDALDSDSTPSVAESTPGNSESFALENFHRSQMKDGKLLWEIVGKNAMYHPSKKSVDIEECIFSMQSDDGRLITLKAGNATLFLDGADLTEAQFTTDVTLHYGKEMKIITPQATYSRAAGVVTSDAHVKVVGSWYMVEGDGLHATLESEEYRILKNVQSVMEPKEDRT